MLVRRTSLILLILLLVITPAVVYKLRQPSQSAGPTLATVERTRIHERDLNARVARLLPAFSYHGNVAEDRLRGIRRTALDQLVLDILVEREARANGLSVDDRAVDAEVGKVRARFTSEGEYYQSLHDYGFTEKEFRALLARDLLVEKATNAHAPKPPSDTDARAYYDANREKFVKPEAIRLTELLVAIDPAGGAAAARTAETKARRLFARLRAGVDFGALAREQSQDAFRVKDGDLGWVHRGRLEQALEDAAFGAPVGQPQIARGDSGFHLFIVRERQLSRQLTFEEAKEGILKRLAQSRAAESSRQWRTSLLAAATVEIHDAGLREAKPLDIRSMAAPGMMTGAAAAVRSH
jgi:parvulin-like peptidyl-prolyl isomerase